MLSRCSPAIIAALPFVAALYPPLGPASLFAILIGTAIAFAACGVLLLWSEATLGRQSGLLLCTAAAACLLASVVLAAYGRERQSARPPARAIAGFTMLLGDDAQKSGSGSYTYSGMLVSVELRDGTRVGRTGSVVVYGGNRGYEWGRVLEVRGALAANKKGDGGLSAFVAPASITPQGWQYPLFRIRAELLRSVEAHIGLLRPSDSGLLTALLLGARDDLALDESYFFLRAGAVHILSLSGLHLAVLSAIFLHLLRPLFGRRASTAITAILLIGYLAIAGPKISLVRAVVMFLLYSAAQLAGRPARAIDLLAVAFIVCGGVVPRSAATLSFRLSFLALLGILTLGGRLSELTASFLPRIIRLPLVASIAAQTMTLPVQVASFGRLQPAGFVSSLVLSPLVTAYMWVGLAFILLAYLDVALLIRYAVPAVSLLHSAIVRSAEGFARIPTLYLEDPRPVVIICFVCVALVYLRVALRRRVR